MRIILFGGAFDPPHYGHQQVVTALLKQQLADQVWLVPVFEHPWAREFNKQAMTAYQLRSQLVKQWLQQDFPQDLRAKMKLVHYQQVSFIYPTLQYFEQQFPEHSFSWVMGSEYVTRFNEFLVGHPKLIDYPFYIYPRAGFPLHKAKLYPNMLLLNSPEIKISSSLIRSAVANNQKINHLVSPATEALIVQQQLYK